MGSYQLALFPCFWLKGLEKWNLTVDLHISLKGGTGVPLQLSGPVFAALAPRSRLSKKGNKHKLFFSLFSPPPVLHSRLAHLRFAVPRPCLPSQSHCCRQDTPLTQVFTQAERRIHHGKQQNKTNPGARFSLFLSAYFMSPEIKPFLLLVFAWWMAYSRTGWLWASP